MLGIRDEGKLHLTKGKEDKDLCQTMKDTGKISTIAKSVYKQTNRNYWKSECKIFPLSSEALFPKIMGHEGKSLEESTVFIG